MNSRHFRSQFANLVATVLATGGAAIVFMSLKRIVDGTWFGDLSMIIAAVGAILFLSGAEYLYARLLTEGD